MAHERSIVPCGWREQRTGEDPLWGPCAAFVVRGLIP